MNLLNALLAYVAKYAQVEYTATSICSVSVVVRATRHLKFMSLLANTSLKQASNENACSAAGDERIVAKAANHQICFCSAHRRYLQPHRFHSLGASSRPEPKILTI
jgi:hypothetical protein